MTYALLEREGEKGCALEHLCELEPLSPLPFKLGIQQSSMQLSMVCCSPSPKRSWVHGCLHVFVHMCVHVICMYAYVEYSDASI